MMLHNPMASNAARTMDPRGLTLGKISYDLVNKPRAYWEVAAEVVAKGPMMPKKRVVPLLREVRAATVARRVVPPDISPVIAADT